MLAEQANNMPKPLDPYGFVPDDLRKQIEQQYDPYGLMPEESKQEAWGSRPRELSPESRRAVEEYAKEAWDSLGARLVRYFSGQLEGTVPGGLRKLAGELPKMMTQPGYAEQHPGVALDLAALGMGAGFKGGLPKGETGVGMTTGAREAVEQAPKATGQALDVAKQTMESMNVPPVEPSRFKSMVAEFGLASPETIFKLDKGGAGNQIYRIADRTDQAMNRFLVNEMNQFKQATGTLKKGSVASGRVARALDGKLPAEQLGQNEKRLYEFLKDKFDFLYNTYAKRLATDEDTYRRLAHAASKDYKPRVRFSELPSAKQNRYLRYVNQLRKIAKGRKVKDLQGHELNAYNRIRGQMRRVLEDAWVEKLAPNDREAYAMMRRKVKNYLPHMFDRDELVAAFRDEIQSLENKLRLTTKAGEQTRIKNRLRQLYESVNKMQGGGMVKYKDLPREFRFKYFQPRKGAKGYEFDAIKAYETYLHGFAKKFFGDPALQRIKELFPQVDPALKPYTRKFVESWAGIDPKTNAQKLAGTIVSWQWMTKLGMNPRSALTNFTQRLNTIAAAGELSSARGWAYGLTDAGKRLFESTGLAQEVPSVLMEGHVPANMERMRQTLGYLFTKAELGNRKHAFLTGYLKAERQGLAEQDAIQAGIDLVHQTQFRYGRVGTPMPLRTPIGRLAFQFWSYPIKQMEFLVGLAKNQPLQLLKLLAYAEGGNMLLKKFVGVDLSNALGFGMNYGEMIKGIQEASDGEIRRAYRHMRLGVMGGGLLPSSWGPTLDSALKFTEAVQRGRGVEAAVRAIMPTQLNKLFKARKAMQEKRGGKYPIFSPSGERMYELTGPELVVSTFGPRVAKESEEYEYWRGGVAAGKEYEQVYGEIVDALVEGKTDKAEGLMKRFGISPTDKALVNAYMRRAVPARTRDMMRTGAKAEYERQER